MDLHRLDLNLLVALDALLAAHSVGKAAARVGVSQPAMSRSLSRLRVALGDPLLVQVGRTYSLTPRAEAIREPLAAALTQIRNALEPPEVDVSSLQFKFRIAAVDYQSYQLLPIALTHLRAGAPKIDVEIHQLADPPEGLLNSGQVDIALANDVMSPALRQVRLFSDRFVGVVSANSPHVSKQISLREYADTPHCALSISGGGRSVVDAALEAKGLRRRVVLRLPHFIAAAVVTSQSDMILTMPFLLANELRKLVPLHLFDPPLELPGYNLNMVWHERSHRQTGLAWVRQIFIDTARQISAQYSDALAAQKDA